MATNDNPQPDLSSRQRRAIAALLTEPDTKRAAEAVKVSYTQLLRWLKLPEFRQAFDQVQAEVFSDHARKLGATLDGNRETFEAIRDDDTKPATARLRAAELLTEYALKFRNLEDIERRIADLEAAVNVKPKRR